MKRLTPCIWFNDQAEQAAKFYCSVFKNSRITKVARYGESASRASGQPKGSVMTVAFRLDGQDFLALNGGPHFKHSPAISFIVNCRTQKEVDFYWKKLAQGGAEGQCGWLTDKFGVSWQVTPAIVGEMAASKDQKRADRAMGALMGMTKLDLAKLKEAYGQ